MNDKKVKNGSSEDIEDIEQSFKDVDALEARQFLGLAHVKAVQSQTYQISKLAKNSEQLLNILENINNNIGSLSNYCKGINENLSLVQKNIHILRGNVFR